MEHCVLARLKHLRMISDSIACDGSREQPLSGVVNSTYSDHGASKRERIIHGRAKRTHNTQTTQHTTHVKHSRSCDTDHRTENQSVRATKPTVRCSTVRKLKYVASLV